MTALFFGCWSNVGHDYRLPGGDSVDDPRTCTPWGYGIDSPTMVARSHAQSEFRLSKRDGWTVIACADYTVDHRGGSMAAFCFDADLDWIEARDAARTHFPGIVARLEAAAAFKLVEADRDHRRA